MYNRSENFQNRFNFYELLFNKRNKVNCDESERYMNRPYIICHMVISVDGKVTGDFLGLPECEAATEVLIENICDTIQ